MLGQVEVPIAKEAFGLHLMTAGRTDRIVEAVSARFLWRLCGFRIGFPKRCRGGLASGKWIGEGIRKVVRQLICCFVNIS
jgi:hypothetical protein